MLGLFQWFLGKTSGILEVFNIMNLLDLGLYEELVFLIVHYFIYYKRALHCIILFAAT
jgi:hypothetical protein